MPDEQKPEQKEVIPTITVSLKNGDVDVQGKGNFRNFLNRIRK